MTTDSMPTVYSVFYSARSASEGSTEAARRAGMAPNTSPIAINTNGAKTNTSGSTALNPGKRLLSILAAANAKGTPAATPATN